jgi:hypothetical protein
MQRVPRPLQAACSAFEEDPVQSGEAPERFYEYDKGDPLRAHIPRTGVSDRRSPVWEVIDVKSKAMRWVERRALADSMLDIFST